MTKVETIRKHFPAWRKREKDADAIPLEMDEELLRNYIDYLGFKDADWTNLPDKVFDMSSYKGTK